MNFSRAARNRYTEAVMDITPLVDVVFLLIIFLLVTTTFKKREHAFVLDLPTATEKELVVRTDQTTVYITQEGEFYYLHVGADDEVPAEAPDSAKPLNTDDLEGALEKLVAADPDAELSIKAQEKTPYQHLIDVVNVARGVGIQRVLLPYEYVAEDGAAAGGAAAPGAGGAAPE